MRPFSLLLAALFLNHAAPAKAGDFARMYGVARRVARHENGLVLARRFAPAFGRWSRRARTPSSTSTPISMEPVLAGRADYVLGSRFKGRSDNLRDMRLYRRIGNVVFTSLVGLLTGRPLTDGQTGMRAFSREAASRAEIVHDYNYAQVLTLDLLHKGFRMEEGPVRYRPREHGSSFVDWRYPVKVIPAILRELCRG